MTGDKLVGPVVQIIRYAGFWFFWPYREYWSTQAHTTQLETPILLIESCFLSNVLFIILSFLVSGSCVFLNMYSWSLEKCWVQNSYCCRTYFFLMKVYPVFHA